MLHYHKSSCILTGICIQADPIVSKHCSPTVSERGRLVPPVQDQGEPTLHQGNRVLLSHPLRQGLRHRGAPHNPRV